VSTDTPLAILNAIADRYEAEKAELARLRNVEKHLIENRDRLWPELVQMLKPAA
jgi:hypothetical protein